MDLRDRLPMPIPPRMLTPALGAAGWRTDLRVPTPMPPPFNVVGRLTDLLLPVLGPPLAVIG